jgi:hypothetical protein
VQHFQAGHVPEANVGRQTAPLPVVPAANAGLVLIPVVPAMRCFFARRRNKNGVADHSFGYALALCFD